MYICSFNCLTAICKNMQTIVEKGMNIGIENFILKYIL